MVKRNRIKGIKYILVAFVAVVMVFATGIYLARPFVNDERSGEQINFWYEMEECGRAGELMNNSLITTVSGNSLKFFQVLNVYCNANEDNLKIVYSKEGNSLLVSEVFDSDEVTRCMCPFKINGEISGLERGSYGFTFSFENKYAGGGFMYDSEFEIA